MSRGFVKEEDQEEAPFIPPRASLPAGVMNYVTPEGLEQLVQEKKGLEEERKNLRTENAVEKRRSLAVLNGKLHLLQDRISSARILNPAEQAQDEVRFGATVSLENINNNSQQNFKIVGVDEADVKRQKIAFVAPIARAVTGKKKGEVVDLQLSGEVRKLKIKEIYYS